LCPDKSAGKTTNEYFIKFFLRHFFVLFAEREESEENKKLAFENSFTQTHIVMHTLSAYFPDMVSPPVKPRKCFSFDDTTAEKYTIQLTEPGFLVH
jgi:hypothetical protein